MMPSSAALQWRSVRGTISHGNLRLRTIDLEVSAPPRCLIILAQGFSRVGRHHTTAARGSTTGVGHRLRRNASNASHDRNASRNDISQSSLLRSAAPYHEPSHTHIAIPHASLELFGNYRVTGPALVHKEDDKLVVYIQGGGHVDFDCGPDQRTLCPEDVCGDGEDAMCCLLCAEYVQVAGDYTIFGSTCTEHLHDKVFVHVRDFGDDNSIILHPGGCLSHPVAVLPGDGDAVHKLTF